jgi:hypothetical protein
MQNDKTVKIQRLRTAALNDKESPEERLISATKLIVDFGPTDRNVPIINKVIRLYENHADFEIAERARKLKVKLIKAKGLKKVVNVELPASDEEPTSSAELTPDIVAGTSAREIPKTAFSLNEVITAYEEVLGSFKWRLLSEGAIELTEEEKMKLLEVVLGDSPNVQNVRNLFDALHVKNSFGWTTAGSCPEIARIAQEFLQKKGVFVEPPQLDAETQKLLDQLNRRDGVSQ